MGNAAQEAIYAQYYNHVVQLAQKTDPSGRVGVSRPELIHSLGISRTIADGLIARCRLKRNRIEGKTEFFSLSKSSKKVLGQGTDDTKETNMDAAPSPADPKGLVGAIVGDDQPTPDPKPKKGKNRLPAEDQGTPPVPTATATPEAPVLATPLVGTRKSPEQLNEDGSPPDLPDAEGAGRGSRRPPPADPVGAPDGLTWSSGSGNNTGYLHVSDADDLGAARAVSREQPAMGNPFYIKHRWAQRQISVSVPLLTSVL
jgi:hypothetical protein